MKLSMRLWRRPRDGMYYVVFDGDRRRSLKTRDTSEAKRIYAQIRKEWLAGKLAHMTGHISSITLGAYRIEYISWAERVQPRSTFRSNRLALDKLIHHAGENTHLDRITLKHLDSIIAHSRDMGLRTASINNAIRHLRCVMNKAVEWKHLKANPFRDARELRGERTAPLYLTQRDATRFIAGIQDVDLRRLVVAYLCTGRRRSELLNLTWEDVDLEHGRYFVRSSKTHLSKWFPMGGMFKAVLTQIRGTHGPVFVRWRHPDTLSHTIKRALRDAGMGHLHLHHLRHSFASMQVMQGRDIKVVQELLGHEDIKATMIYAHVGEDHLRDAVEINLGPVDLG